MLTAKMLATIDVLKADVDVSGLGYRQSSRSSSSAKLSQRVVAAYELET
jgi:hypothetical protein